MVRQEKIDIVKQELESLHHKIRQSYITTYKKLEDTGIKRLGKTFSVLEQNHLKAIEKKPLTRPMI